MKRRLVTTYTILVAVVVLLAWVTPVLADSDAPPPEEASTTPVLLIAGVAVLAVAGISWLAVRRIRTRRLWEEALTDHREEGDRRTGADGEGPPEGGAPR